MCHRLFPVILVAALTASTGLLSARVAHAATIDIDRTLTFDRHEFDAGFEPGPNVYFAVIRDVYKIGTDAVVLPSDTYDQLELTLDFGPGNLIVVDDVGVSNILRFDLIWQKASGSTTSVPYALSYENGSGSLPQSDSPGAIGATANRIRALDGLSANPGGFSFSSMTITSSFAPVATSGTFNVTEWEIEFVYGLDSFEGPFTTDPGRFTSIVPEPASLALLGMGGLVMMRRRRQPA